MRLDEERNLLGLASGVAGAYINAHPTQRPYVEELIGDACVGVAQAVARHDPTKGASLTSYAYRRAVGAVVDGIRQRAPLTRGAYHQEGGDELARRTVPLSLEEITSDTGWAPAGIDSAEAGWDDREHVVQLLRLCTPSERYVLVACVMYGHTLTEVADKLGVTVAAVHHFKKKGLERMRTGKRARRSLSERVSA